MKMQPLPPVSRQVSEARYCYLAANVTRQGGFHVLSAGRERCNPDYRIARQDFPCFGVEFVASGLGKLVIHGHSYPLHPGMLFCYGPGIRHEIVSEPDRVMTKYFVNFFGDEAARALRSGKLRLGRAVQTLEVEAFCLLFDQLIAQGAEKLGNSPEICAAYARIIVLKAAQRVSPATPRISAASANFLRCRSFLDANFARIRDLSDAAEELGVRPAYLCRVFKQFGQPSPFQYLTRRKMNRSAELLVGEGRQVKAAAEEVGYSDPYHFSRLFKQHFGHSPKAFLRLNAHR